MDYKKYLSKAITAAELACGEILEVYHSGDFQTEAKSDASPLTLADKRAHQVICAHLESTGIPILSEEGRDIPYDKRKEWEFLWLVDPLDGTKEFLKRNGEFTVNIALIHRQRPALGVVAVPVTGDVFFGAHGLGAWVKRKGVENPLSVREPADITREGLRVVASRSHMNEETSGFIGSLKDPVLVSKGSSLKFMLLAEGLADVYPRFAPTMEWDTAAAHAIVNAVGLAVIRKNSMEELQYNKPELLNPEFICR
jgi:3'(2'), 5'-bisphosphate nucleotidase